MKTAALYPTSAFSPIFIDFDLYRHLTAIAGADALGGAGSSRAFSFEQASLSSIDSIEISKTVSVDANTRPAPST